MKGSAINQRIREELAKVLRDLDSADKEQMKEKAEAAVKGFAENIQGMNLRAENEFDRLARKVVDSDCTLLATIGLVLAGVLIGAIAF